MLLGLLLLFAIFYPKKSDKLYAYIKAIIIWTIVMYVTLEVWSIVSLISALTLGMTWMVFDVILFIYLMRKQKLYFKVTESLSKRKRFGINGSFCFAEFILAAIALVTLYFALRTVPNNFDSMTYHLPRIMHWAQNGSVAHYSSSVLRQITSPVLAEFINLHVYLLSGNRDIFFNLPQWGAFITCSLLVKGIAGKLNCNRLACAIAGLLFMTMPIAFAESMTTQNDLLAAMWCLALVYVIVDFYTCDKLQFSKEMIEKTIVMSLCVAFGYLTKPSGMFAVLIFGIGLLAVCIKRRDEFKDLIGLLLVAVGSVVAAVIPELARNFYTFHSFSAPIAGAKQLVGTLNARYLFINFLKNFLFNIPNVFWNISQFTEHCIYYMAYIIGVDINDPSIAEEGAVFAMNPVRTYHHDTAINPVIFWSMLIGCIYFLFLLIKKKLNNKYVIYFISAFFNGVFLRVLKMGTIY